MSYELRSAPFVKNYDNFLLYVSIIKTMPAKGEKITEDFVFFDLVV